MIRVLLILILLVLLIGALPGWSYSAGWGYGPSGAVLVILVILCVLLIGKE